MKLINPEIRFEVTNRCNAQCIMCPREKMKRPQGVMDMGLYKRLLDEACLCGARQVSLENYGETFLDPFIFDRAAYARSKGLEVYTISNASLLDEKRCALIAELFTKIRLSMYGVTKETYEKIHKGLDFETVRSGVERLIAVRNASKSALRIEMYFLLMKENEREMKDFLRFYEKRVDAVSVWKPHNWSDGRDFRRKGPKKISCGRPFTGPVQVQWDGLAVPCCFDYDSRIVLGDFNRESIHGVLRGARYEALRLAHKTGDFSRFPFCDQCDQLCKRDDVLVYTTIKNAKVGATNTAYFDLNEDVKANAV